jgi:urease accessory protein
MTWHASLSLDYQPHSKATLEAPHTVVHHRHQGPLRVLQSLYPEGPQICHNVLVHPPSGLVGGDTLDVRVHLQAGTHALITTPGATRFYRSTGEMAVQQVHARLETKARLEWLPLEALAYNGCIARNQAVFELAPGAEMMGWDITALGLPQAQLPFERGEFSQHLEVRGVWLEKGQLSATDQRLMNSPVGLDGKRCIAALFFVAGSDMARERRDAALDAVRAVIDATPMTDGLVAGATSPHPQVLVLRVLADVVEPAMALLQAARAVWRQNLWQLEPVVPRIWKM